MEWPSTDEEYEEKVQRQKVSDRHVPLYSLTLGHLAGMSDALHASLFPHSVQQKAPIKKSVDQRRQADRDLEE